MTKLKLTKSGGFIGRTLSSEIETGIDAKVIQKAVYDAKAQSGEKSRDAFEYELEINDKEGYVIDITKIKSREVKELIENELIKNLKAT